MIAQSAAGAKTRGWTEAHLGSRSALAGLCNHVYRSSQWLTECKSKA